MKKILVIGDLLLDRYLSGESNRLSPEAPVPVVDVSVENVTLGGAGNVINNLSSLKIKAIPVSVIGKDLPGEKILAQLKKAGVDLSLIELDTQRKTPEKTRIVANLQQLARVDIETNTNIGEKLECKIIGSIHRVLKCETSSTAKNAIDVIVISDYGKGVITEAICKTVIRMANELAIPVICDPKGKDFSKYSGATIITPNKKEASEASGINIIDKDSLQKAGEKLLDNFGLKYLLITLGAEGMAFFQPSHPTYTIPTIAREVFDVSGAGDTVVAALSYKLSQHDNVNREKMIEACKFANSAAGVVVGKFGTTTATLDEIEHYMLTHNSNTKFRSSKKILSLSVANEIVNRNKIRGKKVVFTNGCFDLLHAGHIAYLEEAAHLGDLLVVGLNSDNSVRKLKGPNRPICNEDDRALVLAALECVDYLILFEEGTPYNLIASLVPNILVKGGDYNPKSIVGADIVYKHGGVVKIIPYIEGKSTSNLVKMIMERNREPKI